MKEQITNWIMTGIASVGGIGGAIAIICTLVKTFGSNWTNKKLLGIKVDTDKTLQNGINELERRLNTDITVDISAKVDKAITKELEANTEVNANLLEENKIIREALSELLRVFSDLRTNSSEQRANLLAIADRLEAVKEIIHEVKPIAHVTLMPVETQETEPKDKPKEKAYKVVI